MRGLSRDSVAQVARGCDGEAAGLTAEDRALVTARYEALRAESTRLALLLRRAQQQLEAVCVEQDDCWRVLHGGEPWSYGLAEWRQRAAMAGVSR